jgi:hypothetical protein
VKAVSAVVASPEKSKNSGHVCPICKSTYSNIGNFKLHMKTHDNDHLKDQRNQVSMLYNLFRGPT